MRKTLRIPSIAGGALLLLGTAGCATSEQLEALQADVVSAQEMASNAMDRADAAFDLATQANTKADLASDEAQKAMSEAQAARVAAAAADAKAERIFTESLRK
ncbi:hypothetical protein HBA54_22905 [Pelagibius litoralis]|uniref:Outer membrane lipoprotein OprI n=1 Tax=Pelagibius litoralis TaxID=374515 RepID=A0A967F1V5_9PROT|nr:Lpp/OprI family alanine-zipper lipoprotein [Pelagibius litoralis]NIA71447.1 hypothetical protein [Pelagibius litoralis]